MAGFTSAAAFTIATTQIEALLGLKFDDDGFINTWIAVFRDIEQTRTWDAVLGFSSIAILLLLRVGYNCKLQYMVSKRDRNMKRGNEISLDFGSSQNRKRRRENEIAKFIQLDMLADLRFT